MEERRVEMDSMAEVSMDFSFSFSFSFCPRFRRVGFVLGFGRGEGWLIFADVLTAFVYSIILLLINAIFKGFCIEIPNRFENCLKLFYKFLYM